MRIDQHRRRGAGLMAFVCACVIVAQQAHAQVMVVGGPMQQDDQQPPQQPFLLPAQPTDMIEALEDFRRFAGRKQWEKAFKHIEKVLNSKANGLVLANDGIMLPSRLLAREALMELPAPGKEAYRLFYDPEAKKLYEQAQGKEELPKLTEIVSKFLITGVGDAAADRLGDLHFEAGRFSQAIAAWQSILEERPDSKIPRLRLRTKLGTALARQGRWPEFRDLLETVRQQHAGETLTIAGSERPAVAYLERIAGRAPSATGAAQLASARNQGRQDIPLAHNPEPLWQFRMFPNAETDRMGRPKRQGLMVQQMWGQANESDMVLPAVADEQRLYANLVGYDLGIDLETGKLLWRSGRFFEAAQKLGQGNNNRGMNQGPPPLEQFGITASAERVWSVGRDPAKIGKPEGGHFELIAREVATGKQVFSSQESSPLKEWQMRGTPVAAGDHVYVAAGKQNNHRELHVLCLQAKDGKLEWTTLIGSYTVEQNPWMRERTYQPALLLYDGRLYVDCNAGSLVQLDAGSGQIEWGVNYASEVPQGHRFFWYGMQTEQYTVSTPLMVNDVLYFKGMRSTRLFAIDPHRPKVLWHRPVPKKATLIGVDNERFYLGGEDVSAFDLQTKKIVWSVNAQFATTWSRPLMTDNRIYHFSLRGIYEIDKAKGKVVNLFRGHDLDSLGGVLIATPKALVAVSNIAITAYPIGTATGAAEQAAAPAPTEPSSKN